jgi:hypothetical protein
LGGFFPGAIDHAPQIVFLALARSRSFPDLHCLMATCTCIYVYGALETKINAFLHVQSLHTLPTDSKNLVFDITLLEMCGSAGLSCCCEMYLDFLWVYHRHENCYSYPGHSNEVF